MIKCTDCNGSGFSAIHQFEPCEICGGNGNFLSQGEARFGDVDDWQLVRFDGVAMLKVNGSNAVDINGKRVEFYSSDIVESLPELSGIVKLVVDGYKSELSPEAAYLQAEAEHYASYFEAQTEQDGIQLTQLDIDQYNEHMRQGKAMLPVDVVENTLIHEMKSGTWFKRGGITYIKICSAFHDSVALDGFPTNFNYGDKGKVITNVEVALNVGYYTPN